MTQSFFLVLFAVSTGAAMISFAYLYVFGPKVDRNLFDPPILLSAGTAIIAVACLIVLMTASFCPTCDRHVDESEIYCGHCGTQIHIEVPATTCPDCGTETDTPFCTQCGTQVSGRGDA